MSRDLRIGFEVEQFKTMKPIAEYTNEELLEYWRMLRMTCKTGPCDLKSMVSSKEFSSYAFVIDLQDEILKRMNK
jgi:hypothetical protein